MSSNSNLLMIAVTGLRQKTWFGTIAIKLVCSAD